MRVGYVTLYDGRDIKQYSGTSYYLAKSLEKQNIEIIYIGPLKLYRRVWYRSIEYIYREVFKKLYQPERNKNVLKHYAKQINEIISNHKIDVLFSPSTIPLSLVDTKIPIVVYSDAVFAGLLGFYNSFTNVCKTTIISSNQQEQAILERCSAAIFSSEWAAKTAIDNYRFPSKIVRTIPYGANIDTELTLEEVSNLVDAKKSRTCKLLFIGVDWERKGGDVALEVARHLHEKKFDIELTVVGCNPPKNVKIPDYVKVLGFISKSTPEGKGRIQRLFMDNHFLVLPTLADCTPIVFAEANSYGVPCITRHVGGIASIITDYKNGIKFRKDAPTEQYADFIREYYFEDFSKYSSLAMQSYNEYISRLNWTITGKRVKEILLEITAAKKSNEVSLV